MINRLKVIRTELSLTQVNFAKKIGMSQSGYAQVEKGNKNITERLIKSVCMAFNVNEEWFRTGKGEMFIEKKDVEDIEGIIFSAFVKKYKLTPMEQEVAKYCLQLSSEERQLILKYVLDLADTIRDLQSNKTSNRPSAPDHKLTPEQKKAIVNAEIEDEGNMRIS